MPIYAYRCAACGHAADMLRKLSDPPLAVCPACGAPRFEKQVTAAGFQLKGSGWYVTDFRNPPAAPAPAKPAADKPGAEDGAKAPAAPGDGGALPAKPAAPVASDAPTPAAAPAPPSAPASGGDAG